MNYRLINVEDRAHSSPMFRIPAQAARQRLVIGDLAKLVFEPGERMWVEVTGRSDAGSYVGTLRNHPAAPDAVGLRFGEFVTFGAEHICAIEIPSRGTAGAFVTAPGPTTWPTPADIAALGAPTTVETPETAALVRRLMKVEAVAKRWWLAWHLSHWHDRRSLSPAATSCPLCNATPPTFDDTEENDDG